MGSALCATIGGFEEKAFHDGVCRGNLTGTAEYQSAICRYEAKASPKTYAEVGCSKATAVDGGEETHVNMAAVRK